MALIICKHCGKKISDTTSTCIHCGKSLKDEPVVTSPPPVEIKTKDPERKSFETLNQSTRHALEQEFLKANKKAFKFKRREMEFEKFSAVSSKSATTGILLILARISLTHWCSFLTTAAPAG